jgi:hypothetical protein
MTLHRPLSQKLRGVAGAAGLFIAALVITASVVPAAYAETQSLAAGEALQLAQAPAPAAPAPAAVKTAPPKKTDLYDPLNHASITTLVAHAVNAFMALSGTAALFFFIFGGFKMITASGNEKKYAEGLNSLKWAVIGLFIIFGSYAILTTLFNALGAAG